MIFWLQPPPPKAGDATSVKRKTHTRYLLMSTDILFSLHKNQRSSTKRYRRSIEIWIYPDVVESITCICVLFSWDSDFCLNRKWKAVSPVLSGRWLRVLCHPRGCYTLPGNPKLFSSIASSCTNANNANARSTTDLRIVWVCSHMVFFFAAPAPKWQKKLTTKLVDFSWQSRLYYVWKEQIISPINVANLGWSLLANSTILKIHIRAKLAIHSSPSNK